MKYLPKIALILKLDYNSSKNKIILQKFSEGKAGIRHLKPLPQSL
jgi:hypothetical protein